jgi:hypothetical protein
MKRALFLSILIVFFTISFMSLTGCDNLNMIREDSYAQAKNLRKELELSQKCEKKCEEHFRKEYGNGILNNGKRTVTYESHYNKKLNKCFIILTTNFMIEKYNKRYKEKFLFDVNYLRDYGFYHNSGTITFCDVEKNKCGSEEEWVSLVKPYMEE